MARFLIVLGGMMSAFEVQRVCFFSSFSRDRQDAEIFWQYPSLFLCDVLRVVAGAGVQAACLPFFPL